MNNLCLNEEVHVLRIHLDVDVSIVQSLRTLLSAEERNRADRFHFEKDRNRFTVARGSLRQILSSYLDTEANQIHFSYNEFGKPYMEKGLFFNVSHSNTMALIAISKEYEIGVDIEFMEEKESTFKIADRFFAETEVAELMSLPESQRLQGFFNCWTRKEAYIKGRGRGLAIPLGSFGVSLSPRQPARLLYDKNDLNAQHEWSFTSLNPHPDYAGALAVRAPFHQIKQLHYSL